MKLIKEQNGSSVFFRYEDPELDEKAVAGLREKWDAANEEGEVDDLIAEANGIANPRGYITEAHIEELGEDYAVINGQRIEGTLIPEQMKSTYDAGKAVYVYVITCGTELHEWAENNPDILMRGVASDICLAYLRVVGNDVRAWADENGFEGRHFSSLNPGSLKTYNISQQVPTFAILGEGIEKCGVTLTDSMLMVPFKSGDGIYFETEHNFESCMFCDKLNCPNRRATFIGEESSKD